MHEYKYYITIDEIKEIKQQTIYTFYKEHIEEGKRILRDLFKSKEDNDLNLYYLTLNELDSSASNQYKSITTFNKWNKPIIAYSVNKKIIVINDEEADIGKILYKNHTKTTYVKEIKRFNKEYLDNKEDFYLRIDIKGMLLIDSPIIDNFLNDVYQLAGITEAKRDDELITSIKMVWDKKKKSYKMILESFDVNPNKFH